MSGPNFQAIRIHGHGTGCKRVTWEYWLTPTMRPPGAKEEDYPCTCGLEAMVQAWENAPRGTGIYTVPVAQAVTIHGGVAYFNRPVFCHQHGPRGSALLDSCLVSERGLVCPMCYKPVRVATPEEVQMMRDAIDRGGTEVYRADRLTVDGRPAYSQTEQPF